MDKIRVIIPDSHGSMIDKAAAKAFLKDLKTLDADEVVMLGDHVDCGGLFSKHQRAAVEDMAYSYAHDLDCANTFLDAIQKAAPRAAMHYIEGNHEYHVERWAAENIDSERDVARFVADNAPNGKLRLRDRGIRFYRQMGFYQGLAIPNTLRLGECYFTHGIGAGRYATALHLDRFGANVVHGHTHRAQAFKTRNVRAGAHGAWCPGTLALLQPTYLHTSPSGWTHGYAIQFVARSGKFQHVDVPISKGVSLLSPLLTRLAA